MLRAAIISSCGVYRPELRRIWDSTLPLLVVCMVNPSDADSQRDDPTVLTLIHFAKLWGYGGLLIVNLYDFRSPSQAAMQSSQAPIGPQNAAYLESAMKYACSHGRQILVAWGNGGSFEDRDEWFANRALNAHGIDLICLGRTKAGHPKHPMARGRHRIPRDQLPIIWRRAL